MTLADRVELDVVSVTLAFPVARMLLHHPHCALAQLGRVRLQRLLRRFHGPTLPNVGAPGNPARFNLVATLDKGEIVERAANELHRMIERIVVWPASTERIHL